MPHTSHKKKPIRNKRTEIVDEDGWTRVASNHFPTKSPTPALSCLDPSDEVNSRKGDSYIVKIDDGSWIDVGPIDQAPEHTALEDVSDKYRKIETKFKASESWISMQQTLQTRILGEQVRIDACVLFGSGTFTGLGSGWMNRSHVAMYQLAAFISVADAIEQQTGHRPMMAAQEPCYNLLDGPFLDSLGVRKVDHPQGFDLLTSNSFAYCPGAEQYVVLRTLRADPYLYLAGKLDAYRGALGCLQSRVISVAYEVYDDEETSLEIKGSDSDVKPEQILGLTEIEEIVEEDKRPLYNDGVKIDRQWVKGKRLGQEADVDVIQHFLLDKELAKVPDLDAQDFPIHDTYFHWRARGQEEQNVP